MSLLEHFFGSGFRLGHKALRDVVEAFLLFVEGILVNAFQFLLFGFKPLFGRHFFVGKPLFGPRPFFVDSLFRLFLFGSKALGGSILFVGDALFCFGLYRRELIFCGFAGGMELFRFRIQLALQHRHLRFKFRTALLAFCISLRALDAHYQNTDYDSEDCAQNSDCYGHTILLLLLRIYRFFTKLCQIL